MVWHQAGRLLSGAQWRIETGETRAEDLATIVPGQVGSSTAFTTSVERRTIGVTTTVDGDFDGARWWLTVDINASNDRGGEKVVKVQVRPVVAFGDWFPCAVMTRDEAEKIVRALPGGFWKTRRKTLTSENYTLRVRVDPVEDPAAPAAPVFVDSK